MNLYLALALLMGTVQNPFYADKMVPGTDTVSCCRNKDCSPVTDWRYYNHKYEVLMDGTWHTPPQRLVRQELTPDGRAHACYKKVGNYTTFFCIFIPMSTI